MSSSNNSSKDPSPSNSSSNLDSSIYNPSNSSITSNAVIELIYKKKPYTLSYF